jgi:hypothetical protein
MVACNFATVDERVRFPLDALRGLILKEERYFCNLCRTEYKPESNNVKGIQWVGFDQRVIGRREDLVPSRDNLVSMDVKMANHHLCVNCIEDIKKEFKNLVLQNQKK